MSLPYRKLEAVLAVPAVLAAAIAAAAPSSAATDSPPPAPTASDLVPAMGSPPPPDPHAGAFSTDVGHIADGKRLYVFYHCGGCHFKGGGGIGPALTDDRWVYGNRIEQVFSSIYQGRANGMPAWGGKIPDAQIWELAAYVLSLRAPEPPFGGVSQ